MKPRPIPEMQKDRELCLIQAANKTADANMLEMCLECQMTKRYKECPANCPNISVQS